MLRPKQFVKKTPHRLPNIRRSTRPQSWSKKVGRAIGIFFLIVLDFALIVWMSCQIWKILTTDREFSISEIHVMGAKSISVDTIVRRSRLKTGDNIFKVDLKMAQSILEAEPQFKRVEVWRQLPRDVFIRVDERVPVAQIQSKDGDVCWLIDDERVILSACGPGQDMYPRIIGWEGLQNMKRGITLEGTGYQNAMEVLSLLSDSVLMKMFRLENLNIETSNDIVLLGQNGVSVKVGHEDFENRVLRFYSILEDLEKKSKQAASIDLRFKYVPVVLKEVNGKKHTS